MKIFSDTFTSWCVFHINSCIIWVTVISLLMFKLMIFMTSLDIYSVLDKLLGQLGIYATWLFANAYLQKQLRIFFFFCHIFFLWLHVFLLHEAIGNVLAYLFTPIVCLSKVSNKRVLLYLKQISSPCWHSSVYTLQSFIFIIVFFRKILDWAPIFYS